MIPFWNQMSDIGMRGAYVFLILVAFWLLSGILARLLGAMANKAGDTRRDVILLGAQAVRIALLLVGIVVALGAVGINLAALVVSLGFWDQAVAAGMRGACALLILAGFWLLSKILVRLVGTIANRASDTRRDVILLGAQATKVVILIIGIITALGTAGVNVSALVASLGLTGFALGFAFKDVLSNLLAGAMILFYRPFRHGERITVTTFEGTVSSIDFRYTTLEDAGRKYLIPNSTMLSNVITVTRSPSHD